MKGKVLMLLSNEFRPDVRVEKEASALSHEGLQVVVFAWDRECKFPEEEKSDFRVRRIRVGKVSRKISYFLNLGRFYLTVIKLAKKEKPDVVHAHDLDTLIPGVIISKLNEAKLVYDAHEHYAYMVSEDVPNFVVKILDELERILVRKVSLIIAANERIADYLKKWFPGEIVVVMNCIDIPLEKHQIIKKNEKEITIFYGGSLEPNRYIEEMISFVESNEGLRFVLAGRGRLEKKVVEAAKRCSRIEFVGYKNKTEIYDLISSADVVMVMMDPSNLNNQIGTPNRLFEAMALGTPVLTSKGTLAGEIVERVGCGLSLNWNKEELLMAFETLMNTNKRKQMISNAKRIVENEYNWSFMRGRLVNAFESLFL
ncbi:MAG: glycosyltransferase [Methanomassiliicoccales archaeon]